MDVPGLSQVFDAITGKVKREVSEAPVKEVASAATKAVSETVPHVPIIGDVVGGVQRVSEIVGGLTELHKRGSEKIQEEFFPSQGVNSKPKP